MQVRVNVINEMKKLRSSTYSDKYAWVDEVVQNCQRSGATHIDVMFDDDSITITDNGCGCTDPQVLFDKSSSGWDDSIAQSENPFGEGFFSTMMAANTIQVKSVGFNAVFDVKKMFEMNSVDVIDVTPNRKKSGFVLTLTDLQPDISIWTAMERFRKVGRYIKSPTMTIDGERVKYEGLDPKEDSPFIHKFNTPLFKGWIIPDSWADCNRKFGEEIEIKCFAFSRLIKKTKTFSGVRGVISFKENAVTLRSPDRKEFVHDSKYEACIDAFYEEIKKMYMKLIKIGSDQTISDYDSYIKQYVDMDDYKKYVKFKILREQKTEEKSIETNINYIDMAEDAPVDTNTSDTDITDNNQPSDTVQEDTYMDDESYSDPFTTDIDDSPISDINSAVINPGIDFDVVTQLTGNNRIAAQTTTSVTKKHKHVSEQTGDSISDLEYGFYLDNHETLQYKEEIQIAQYYEIPVITLRNSLERAIVNADDRFKHIREIPNMITLNAEYHNTFPANEQEQRAMKLLSRVAKAMNMDESMFVIADTKFQKVLAMDNGEEHVIENIDVIATACDNKVYIDRSHMTAYKDLTNDSDKLTPADIKFLLINGETLAHEISHAVYKTVDNTMEHMEKTLIIMKRIINLIYGLPSLNHNS